MEIKMENQEPEAIMQNVPQEMMQDAPQEMPGELAESIDNWRHSVPSRMEREDPFVNDGFVPRPETRVVSTLLIITTKSIILIVCYRPFVSRRSLLFAAHRPASP